MGIRATVDITSKIGAVTAEVLAAAQHGVNLAAEELLTLSAERVPLEWGTLQGSGTVERSTSIDEGATVVYDQPYAARLHEHPEYDFQGGREGKYLENPALENKDRLGEIIAKQIRLAGG